MHSKIDALCSKMDSLRARADRFFTRRNDAETKEQKAEEDGAKAARAGDDMESNPYPNGPLFRAWHRGFMRASGKRDQDMARADARDFDPAVQGIAAARQEAQARREDASLLAAAQRILPKMAQASSAMADDMRRAIDALQRNPGGSRERALVERMMRSRF